MPRIFVKGETGYTVEVEVEGSNTLADVKGKVFDKMNIPSEAQRLIMSGVELGGWGDDMTVEEAGITNDATVMIALNPAGGQGTCERIVWIIVGIFFFPISLLCCFIPNCRNTWFCN